MSASQTSAPIVQRFPDLEPFPQRTVIMRQILNFGLPAPISFNAQVGVATAEFYPTFTLTGTAGFESAGFSHILEGVATLVERLNAMARAAAGGGQLLDREPAARDWKSRHRSEKA